MEAIKDIEAINLIDGRIEIPSKLETLGRSLELEMQRHQKQILEKKERLITSRAKEINPNYDPEAEKGKRFKSLMVERGDNGQETYYFNDGTEDGLRLITFITSEPKIAPAEGEMDKICYTYEVKYY